MASPIRLDRGFTFAELLAHLAIVSALGILVILALPWLFRPVGVGLIKSPVIQCISNARQIYLASISIAPDGTTNQDPSLGWPGDLKAKGRIATLGDYANVLVRSGYLKPGDLKIFSGPGCKSYPGGTLGSGSNGVLVPAFTDEYSALKVYLVKDVDPSNTLFLASKNYTYNTPLNDPKAKPFGDTGFIVLRKGGDASSLKKKQAQSLQFIGQLPGGGSVESAENCLNPDPTAP